MKSATTTMKTKGALWQANRKPFAQ